VSRRTLAALIAVVGILFVLGGFYEWSQTKTCGPASGAHCTSGKHVHPHRAYGLWAVGVVLLVAAGGVAATERRSG